MHRVIFGSDHNGLLLKKMESLMERLVAARKQVGNLLGERMRTAAAMEGLEARIQDQGREAAVLRARIQELEQEAEVLHTNQAPATGPGREGSKEKIDELVSEIDRCLELLTN